MYGLWRSAQVRKCWKSKVISNMTVTLLGGMSKFTIPGPSSPETCENNYSRYLFLETLYCRYTIRFWVCLRFWISQGSEYPRILNMSLVLNVPEFWIYQGSECASSFEYAIILEISEFWTWQGYTWFKIRLNKSWICLNVLNYVWICLNVPKYAEICVNMPKSALLAFVLHFRVPSIILQFFAYFNTWLLIWTSTGD